MLNSWVAHLIVCLHICFTALQALKAADGVGGKRAAVGGLSFGAKTAAKPAFA